MSRQRPASTDAAQARVSALRFAAEVVVLAVVGGLGGIAGGWLVQTRGFGGRMRSGEDRQAAADRLEEEMLNSQEGFARALSAHSSLAGRLSGMAQSACEHASALERMHDVGLAPRGIKANADWRPARELSSDLPRPGAEEAWQALDRSFQALLATLDDPASSYAEHACAYTAISEASGELAEMLAHAPLDELAAGCSFCGKPRTRLGKLIAGPGVFICDECVSLCAAIMEDDAGEGWRDAADERRADDPDKD